MSAAGDEIPDAAQRFALPTTESMRRATFEQATRIGTSVCTALQASMTSSPTSPPADELASALRSMLCTSNGARGFFSVYLTSPAMTVADMHAAPRPLVLALDGAPADAHRALLRTLVSSSATWLLHRKLEQEQLAHMTARTSARAGALLAATRAPNVLHTLVQLRTACRMGADGISEPREPEHEPDLSEPNLGLTAPLPVDDDTPHAQPTWAEVIISSGKYTPEQLLAIGIALDRVVHQRLVAGDPNWRELPNLRAALAAGAAATDGAATGGAAAGGTSGVRAKLAPNGLLTLHLARGGQLNALSAAMLGDILDAAASAASSASPVRALLLRSDDARAFSAGGDVRALSATPTSDARAAILQLEYAAIAAVAELARNMPVVAIADGVTMGAGMGLFMAANRRLVSERARLAMPECAIGLIPDAGTTHHLTALPPGFVGMYCALSGATLSPADALYAGLATGHVRAAAIVDLEARLSSGDLAGLDAALAALCEPMREHSTLSRVQARIDSIFAQPNYEQARARARAARVTPRARAPLACRRRDVPRCSCARRHAWRSALRSTRCARGCPSAAEATRSWRTGRCTLRTSGSRSARRGWTQARLQRS